MKAKEFIEAIDSSFYTGVPDSLLRPLCDTIMSAYGNDPAHHIVAANEGNAVAIAAGYYLSTGRIPAVYMQNSGEGNTVNPVASLLNEKVYGIPEIFIIGWRGEPGVHDEPQHIFQGEITKELLEVLNIKYFVISADTEISELDAVMKDFRSELSEGRSVAFVVKKNALVSDEKMAYKNDHEIIREDAIREIAHVTGDDVVVSTTGKASRELFEIREKSGGHENDFLTVGSMGHCSSIALGIAVSRPDQRVWCIDGDGAVLMHMGAMAVIGKIKPDNLKHIVLNNEAHETVGGMPTAADTAKLIRIAEDCGYERARSVDNIADLKAALNDIRSESGLSFLEVKCALGARADLGRPTTTAQENKEMFMKRLGSL